MQGEDTECLCGAISAIAEVFKLTDPTLLFLEVTTLVSKYPDIRYISLTHTHTHTFQGEFVPPVNTSLCREDHIQALLTVRGDASREMRQMIIGTLSENRVSYAGVTQPIFTDITVPSNSMASMTAMTSMATSKLLK